MQVFRPEDVDEEILNDLLEEVHELYEASEQTLIELEIRPEDNELQRALFRSVHTIKGDLGLVNFSPLMPLLQHVEDLLDFLRNGKMRYTSIMSDLVLLTMDRVKLFVESCMHKGMASYDPELFNHLAAQIGRIKPDNGSEHDQLLADAVLLLNPNLDVSGSRKESTKPTRPAQTSATPETALGKPPVTQSNTERGMPELPFDVAEETRADVEFFRDLMGPVEERTQYLEGRGDRMAKLALLLNKLAGSPVDREQLLVACYVHDFGMAFMPLPLLHKPEPLSDQEFNLMRSHVYKSARLLEHLETWNEARKIVMQHHERMDGSGYPMGMKGEDICQGARLIAILDTFEAMTHSRANEHHTKLAKKSAVVEMNRVAEGQFCPRWMQVFNRAMAGLLR